MVKKRIHLNSAVVFGITNVILSLVALFDSILWNFYILTRSPHLPPWNGGGKPSLVINRRRLWIVIPIKSMLTHRVLRIE